MDYLVLIGVVDRDLLFDLRDLLDKENIAFTTKRSKFEKYRWVVMIPATTHEAGDAIGGLVHSYFPQLFYWIKYVGKEEDDT